jgi:hypothetical protein
LLPTFSFGQFDSNCKSYATAPSRDDGMSTQNDSFFFGIFWQASEEVAFLSGENG